MKTNVGQLGAKIVGDLKMVGKAADRLGFQAYVVGGVVRDIILRRKSFDLDIVIEGDAIALAKQLAKTHGAKITFYSQFGTATLTFANGVVMDLATARKEVYPQPGALPVVRPGTIREDLFRRDFTINALALALNPGRFGELQDFYDGLADLKKKKVRILHDQSFVDDPTRILRAVRFEQRFGFQMDRETLKLLQQALKSGAPATVKSQRYFEEFRKIFSESDPVPAIRRLTALKGLDFIAPHFNPDIALLSRTQKTIDHLKKKAFYRKKDWAPVFLLAFFSRLASEKLKHLETKFHLTREERASLNGLSQVKGLERQLDAKWLSAAEIYEILDPVDVEIIYFIRVATSVNIVTSRAGEFLEKWRLVTLAITGQDLKDLGVIPGREMGALLHALLLLKLDRKIKSRKDEIVMARRLGFAHTRS